MEDGRNDKKDDTDDENDHCVCGEMGVVGFALDDHVNWQYRAHREDDHHDDDERGCVEP